MKPYRCKICFRSCKESQDCIFCDLCNCWLHLKCTDLTKEQFYRLGLSDENFFCKFCILKLFPFNSINDSQFIAQVKTCKESKKAVKNSKLNLKYPCKLCLKSCKSNQNCILCDICGVWSHIRCVPLTLSQFKSLTTDVSMPYFCPSCVLDNLPVNCLDSDEYCQVQEGEGYLSLSNIKEHFVSSNKNKDFTILHCNIRSLIKNIDSLSELILTFPFPPDIVAVSETKLNENSNLRAELLPGYNLFFQNSLSKAGGVAVFVRKSLACRERSDLAHTEQDHEVIFVEIQSGDKKLANSLIGVVYRHPQNPIPMFTEKMSKYLLEIMKDGNNIYLVGDFNIDLKKADSNSNISNYLDMITSYNLTNTVKHATRVCNTSKTLIDHFYSSSNLDLVSTSILISDISDHLPLLVTIKKVKPKVVVTKDEWCFHRSYRSLDVSAIKNDTSSLFNNLVDKYHHLPEIDINTKFEMLSSALKSVLDKHMPLKKLSRKEERLKAKPWITRGILRSIKTRNQLYKILVKTNFKDRKLLSKYKKFRNKLTHIKQKSKCMYYQNRFKDCNGDTAKTWKIINGIIKSTSKSSQVPVKLETESETLTEDKAILNSLNEHFTSIGKSYINSNIDYSKVSSYLNCKQLNSVFFSNTTASEVKSIISQLDSKKACGADEISVSFLKMIKDIISPILSELINESYCSGMYPSCLKIAKVVPVFKGGEKSKPGNYRPISLLSIVNKIIEKTIYSRLIKYFNKNNLINDSQFGFRKGFNTTMAITEFYEQILNAHDKRHATCAVLLDLSKAFDSVDHNIVLHKLYSYGVRGNVWQLLKSYLLERKQFVSGNNKHSDLCSIDVGVPQGSVLGPLLFLIHINDLKNATDLKVLNFADDTLLYFNFSDKNFAQQYLNSELEKIEEWLSCNKLKANSSKTKYMVFAPRLRAYSNINFQLKLTNGCVIDKVNEYKYLGLIVDDKLTWKPHIKRLKSQLSKSLGILYKLRHLTNKQVLKMVFHSLFFSHLNYGLLCWARANKTYLNPLKILLNKALRCINFCNYTDPVTHILYKDKLLQVDELFKLELGKFMYRFSNGGLPQKFDDYFNEIKVSHSYGTRVSKCNYFLPRKNSSKGLHGLNYLGPRLWSDIPENIKNKKSLSLFTSSYKNFLSETYSLL